MEWIVNEYYKDNAKKLRTMVDKILFKLKFHDVDNEDFYSLANEIFLDALCRYDGEQDFKGFLYVCLTNKFKTKMTGENRNKRCLKVEVKEKNINGEEEIVKKAIKDVSIYAPIYNDKTDSTTSIADIVPSKQNVESEIFSEKEEGYSDKMNVYLSRLSPLQREVLRLISIKFTPKEILEELHINQKTYEDCYAAIHSYRNISILI